MSILGVFGIFAKKLAKTPSHCDLISPKPAFWWFLGVFGEIDV